jgi:hypothetical protein
LAYQFFAEGLPFPLTTVYFYVEGIGFVIALLFFYRVFVMGGGQFPARLYAVIETSIIDRSYNERIVKGVLGLSNALKGVHTGNLNAYLFWVVLGTLLIFVMILLSSGGIGGF